MKTGEVPDELVVLALSAAAKNPPTTDIHDLIDYNLDDHEDMTRALAAVLPAHEQMVRAKVAEEVEATRERWSSVEPEESNVCMAVNEHNCHRDAGERSFTEAARIARGEA